MKLCAFAGLFGGLLATLGCASASPRSPASVPTPMLTSAEGREAIASPPEAGGAPASAAPTTPEVDPDVDGRPVIATESTVAEPSSPATGEVRDPLAVSAFEEAAIPTTDITPASRLRKKTAAQLNAAMGFALSATTVDDAARELAQRLGEPSWTEAPKSSSVTKRRIWIADATGPQCQRLVLEADGSVVVESASRTEWRMLTAGSRQNPCTGEIRRGFSE